MGDTPLKDMSTRHIRKRIAAQLLRLSEWNPDKEVSAVEAVDVMRRQTIRCLSATAVVLGRLLEEHPDV